VSDYLLARFNFLVIVSLLLTPLSYASATDAPRWPAETPPVSAALPGWFSARPGPATAPVAQGVMMQ
jgi:hypothetical protein